MLTTRSSISSGDMPLNCQITVTTGSGIAGKMSTGVVTIATSPAMRTRRAPLTNVYGRRSATRTIHIIGRPSQLAPEQRFEAGPGHLIGEARAHQVELGLHQALLRGQQVQDYGDAIAIAHRDDSQVLGRDPDRFDRERHV